MCRTNVERNQCGCSEQYRPQPDREVCGVQVGSPRSAVSLNLDGPACKDVAYEVADREVLVQWKMWAAKGPTARNLAFQSRRARMDCAKQFGCSLSLRIYILGVQRVGRSEVVFRNMRNVGGLFPIYRTRTGEQEFLCPTRGRELQDALGSAHDGAKGL